MTTEMEEEEAQSLSPFQLLHLAESHLRLRNFGLSREYALEALQADAGADSHLPRHICRRVSQIVAISDVLSASAETTPNWYSVLGVDTFCCDLNLVRAQFKGLLLLLSSLRGKSQLADEALLAARNGWNVLSNPVKKKELDDQLKAEIARDSRGMDSEEKTFWTFCPYCYYMYEFNRVYVGCCLRCQNTECKRAFHGVSSWNPPPAALKNGESFSCFGCFPLGFLHFEGTGDVKFASWSPFVGMVSFSEARTDGKRNFIVETLDDSEESEAPLHSGAQQAQFVNLGSRINEVEDATRAMNQKSMARDEMESTGNVRGFRKNKNVNLNNASGLQDVDGDEWNEGGDYGFELAQDTMGGDGCGPDVDVGFFEKDGEIFVEIPPDDGTF